MKTQLDRIEEKLDLLLAKKKRSPAETKNCPEFDLFWDAYPLKKAKKAAQLAYKKIPISMREDVLNDVIERRNNDISWLDGFIPYAATYINGARWEDVITVAPKQAESIPKSNDDIVAWAENKGFRNPVPGESFSEYRRHVEQLYREH